jgi:diguanylate cyclase (GGDEF)-like protein/putative nucleotidyltransferase with HDIG domain
MDSASLVVRQVRLPLITVPRLPLVVVPVLAGAAAVVVLAVSQLGGTPASAFAGAGVFLLAATVAEAFPVRIVGVAAGATSLATIFIVATAVVYSWQLATLVGLLTMLLVEARRRQPLVRVAYNSALYSLGGAAAGAIALVVPSHTDIGLLSAGAFYVTDIVLLAAVVSAANSGRFPSVLRGYLASTLTPFLLMATTTAILVVLWGQTPALVLLLVPPLVAIELYQRSSSRELRAMHLARTDPLTGLGNYRHFQERLELELAAAEQSQTRLTLCLVDIDDFKRINDRFGHPAGDRILTRVAELLRQGGEAAFRLGGDEFAVLLPGVDEPAALTAVKSIASRIGSLKDEEVDQVLASSGVATFPMQGASRDELVRLADRALYWAKEHGKNQVRLYRPDVVDLALLKRLGVGSDLAARYRAAASLAKAVDARDEYTGSHSTRVSEIAARIASRLGLDEEQTELIRLATSLHDLGKLSIPEEILRKPDTVSDTERLVLERHPRIGYQMLESLGVDPIADWVLHHHERWDGTGYPDRLAGEQIPLGARIIFVADAYDAMTSDRVYRRRLTDDEARSELVRCAGTQFDPTIVAAFMDELEASGATVDALAS